MCDHLGDYSLYTRMVGYRPVRVYHCKSCGGHLAMDGLPRNLTRRMYPLLEPAPVSSALPKVDFCVSIGGNSAELLCRIFFWSLGRAAATLDGVTFHLVNRGISQEEFSRICAMVPQCKSYTRPPIPDRLIQREKNKRFPIGEELLGLDAEWTCQWMIENCGCADYAVLSHFDIFFVGDFLNYLRSKVTEKTGMLGQHCPFVLLSRKAFSNSFFKFRPIGPFYAVPLPEQPKEFHLYFYGDPRIGPGALQTGFDNGELLELELRFLGWDTDPLREEYDKYFYHLMGGDRVKDGEEFASIQDRARMFIDAYNIPENPIIGK